MENNRKIILIIAVVLAIFAVLFFVLKNVASAPKLEIPLENVATTTVEKEIENTSILPKQTLPFSDDSKDTAWTVFQKYLGYNLDKNLDGVKQTVYKVNVVCESAVATDECKNRMDMAYAYGSVLKKEDFTNIWSDSKQTILATDFKIQEDDTAIGRNRAILFFVKNNAGNSVLLSFSPFKGSVLEKASTTREELISKLTTYTEDTDKDGIANYEEQCLAPYESSTCVKTNPNLRDTDSNGFWDGVQALMK
ncbi:MAG: hypothetical protein AAB446_03140 [Patescibacteria group bacterium]